jgi:hypothetical protein
MNWILKLVASAAIKSGISTTHAILLIAINAIVGVLMGGNISDDYRARLEAVKKALQAVMDFVARLAELMGAPVSVARQASLTLDIDALADNLRKVTGNL